MRVNIIIALYRCSGREFCAAEGVKGSLLKNLSCQADCGPHVAAILCTAHVVEQDARRCSCPSIAQANMAPAGRAHGAHMGLKTMATGWRLAVIPHRQRQKMVLQVRLAQAGLAADKTAGLKMIGGTQTPAKQQPLQTNLELVERLERRKQRDRLGALVLHIGLEVVLQVFAHAGQR